MRRVQRSRPSRSRWLWKSSWSWQTLRSLRHHAMLLRPQLPQVLLARIRRRRRGGVGHGRAGLLLGCHLRGLRGAAHAAGQRRGRNERLGRAGLASPFGVALLALGLLLLRDGAAFGVDLVARQL